jgi:hypothetical protein
MRPAVKHPGYAALAAAIAAAILVGATQGLIERLGPADREPSMAFAPAPGVSDDDGGRQEAPILGCVRPAPVGVDAEWSAFDVAFADVTASGRTILEPAFPEPDAGAQSATRTTGVSVASLAQPADPSGAAQTSSPDAAATSWPVPPPLPAVRERTVRTVPPRKPQPPQADVAESGSGDCWWQGSSISTNPRACLESLRRLVAEDRGSTSPRAGALAAADPPPHATPDRAGASRE